MGRRLPPRWRTIASRLTPVIFAIVAFGLVLAVTMAARLFAAAQTQPDVAVALRHIARALAFPS